MKKIYTVTFALFGLFVSAQNNAPASPYYDDISWSATGSTMKSALATKITQTHTRILSYSQAESAIKIVDIDPVDATNTNVLLIYGFDNVSLCNYSSESSFGTSSNGTEHRRRHKEADVSGSDLCAWNREHVYPKSLGTPNLEEVGAGADAHHLRACDVVRNANRGNLKFGPGSGNSRSINSLWYPGDEWIGDVARNMMYLYLRYPSQCKPTGVGTGAVVATDTAMLQLFLEWNAADPVSEYEDRRNTYLGNASNSLGQGNRNPFIDNPYLATVIWGGTPAQNRWPVVFPTASVFAFDLFAETKIYPNPSSDNKININSSLALDEIQIININGQIMQLIQKPTFSDNNFSIDNLPSGFYFVKLHAENKSITKKVIVN